MNSRANESYYNTTSAEGRELIQFELQALSQEEAILWFFQNAPEFYYTPSQIMVAVFGRKPVPLTSVRRALSNLTAQGKLVKSYKKRQGPYGRPEHCWYLKGMPKQEELFE